jgi:hypothetical protein
VSNHSLVKLANLACVNVKKRFQELEEKLFGLSVRTKARNIHSGPSEHYEIEINLGAATCNASRKSWHGRHCLRVRTFQMRIHQPSKVCEHISAVAMKAVSRAKKTEIIREVLLSCMDDC